MSEVLAKHIEIGRQLLQQQPELLLVAQEDAYRLEVAVALQEALELKIDGSDLVHIHRAKLAEKSGLPAPEIYGLAHADRRFPLEHVFQLISALGLSVNFVPPPIAAR